MSSLFWEAVGLVLYTYAGYPLLMWMLSRMRAKPWRKADVSPSVSIVMAVHNGAALLERKIEHLSNLDYPNIAEIICVSDGSTDETNSILHQLPGNLRKSIVLEEQSGKAVALNRGIEAATGEIILFVDIRPWLGERSVAKLMRSFADPSVGCVAGELTVESGGGDAGTEAVGGIYWRYEQWLRDCEARFDSPLGVYGGYYAVRRELAVPFPAGIILDDMYQPLSIVREGYRSVLDAEAKVYDAWPKASADEFRRKVRTLAGNFQLVELAPWLLGPSNRLWFQFVCHKMLRLIVPLLLGVALISSSWIAIAEHSSLFVAFTVLQIAFYAAAAWGKKVKLGSVQKIAGVAEAFCMLNVAAVVAFFKYLFSPRPLWKMLWSKSHIDSATQAQSKIGAVAGR